MFWGKDDQLFCEPDERGAFRIIDSGFFHVEMGNRCNAVIRIWFSLNETIFFQVLWYREMRS